MVDAAAVAEMTFLLVRVTYLFVAFTVPILTESRWAFLGLVIPGLVIFS